ncbi:MAG: gamma-glutamylcyclotransferase family protein [Opitutaceae bacterium]|jgi:gamma-glutamylcyclotransferase (GGCT)/AIG2-like uncharacterized protein YtfP
MPELTGHMLHFAYGEDLSRTVFTQVCAGAEWFGPARLDGHRLLFDAIGRANVRTDAGSTVWGALWLVPASMLPILDTSAPEGYVRTTRRIVSPAGPRTEATLYLSTKRGESAPTKERLRAMIDAAHENRLPAAYIKELEELGSPGKSAKDSR